MQVYPNNSLVGKRSYETTREKEESQTPELPKTFKPVIDSGSKVVESSGFRRLLKSLLPDDLNEFKKGVWNNIIVPAGKRVVQETVDAFLNNDTPYRTNYSRTGSSTWRSPYNDRVSIFSWGNENRSSATSSPQPADDRRTVDEVMVEFDDIGKAKKVLASMREALAYYKILPVAAMYDFANQSCPFTYEDWGWTDLSKAEVVRLPGGKYTIDVPKALPIK